MEPDLLTSEERRPRRALRREPARAVVLAGVALAGVALGAAGVAAAADGSGSPTPNATASSTVTATPAPAHPGTNGNAPQRERHGLRRGALGAMGALHGELVVPKPGGGYQTVAVQRGTVTAVSRTSITVKSADSFTASYTVTADTLVNAARDGIGTVKAGDEVHVVAVVDGTAPRALRIVDVSRQQDFRERFGPGRFGHR